MYHAYNLQRFLDAQAAVYSDVCAELVSGDKETHWMWFIFPQIAGLGHSAMAQRYAITNRAEAIAYLANPVLGSRLVHCTEMMLNHTDKSARQILGAVDELKFCSSMTLFDVVQTGIPTFGVALDRFFRGARDGRTLQLLAT
jgi:uncharacterized protein (DUF1810 family)